MSRWFDAPTVRLKGLLETLPNNTGAPRLLFIQRTASEFVRETKVSLTLPHAHHLQVRVTNLPLASKKEIYDVLADIEDTIKDTLKICEGKSFLNVCQKVPEFARDPSVRSKLDTQITEALAVLDDLTW